MKKLTCLITLLMLLAMSAAMTVCAQGRLGRGAALADFNSLMQDNNVLHRSMIRSSEIHGDDARALARQSYSLEQDFYDRISDINARLGKDSMNVLMTRMRDEVLADTTDTEACMQYASICHKMYRYDDAVKFYQIAVRALEDEPIACAKAQVGLSSVMVSLNKHREAKVLATEALSTIEEYADGDSTFFMLERCIAIKELSRCLRAERDTAGFLQYSERCKAGLIYVVRQDSIYIRELIDFLGLYANYLYTLKMFDASDANLDMALQLMLPLYQQKPRRHQAMLGYLYVRKGANMYVRQRYKEALTQFLKADEYYEQAYADNPDAYERFLANNLDNLGNSYKLDKQYELALSYYNRGLVICQNFANKTLDASFFMYSLWNSVIDTEEKMDRWEDAFAHAQEHQQEIKDLYDKYPKRFRNVYAVWLANMAECYNHQGDTDQALRYINQAIEVQPTNTALTDYRDSLTRR